MVRLLLVPAIMQLLGRANWWLPTSINRKLPDFNIEGRPEFHTPEKAIHTPHITSTGPVMEHTM
ncbi:hypothetical protein M2271_006630 [Streptomyces sp. LBL]|uniref:hypothetical protein n=1 Tax=Streptomyces sp. LBL TaxID=2940562 RepID=UPI002474F1FC|nr:hypothetical protein [Streptomyces sp. LBL]MDH6628795.1 hypothetical protein [Streptomyces sp. LBL]